MILSGCDGTPGRLLRRDKLPSTFFARFAQDRQRLGPSRMARARLAHDSEATVRGRRETKATMS